MANFPVNLTIKAFDHASAKFDGINKKLEGLRNSSSRLKTAFQLTSSTLNLGGVANALGGIGTGFRNLASGVGQSLTRLGLSVGAAGTGIFLLAKHTSEEIDMLSKTSRRLGFTIEGFQELQHAAKLSGINTEEFTKSVSEMNKRLGEAKIGQGALQSVLSKAAPNFLKQLKLAKNNEQAFDLLSTAIFSIKDPTQKAALATAAFGKAGSRLVTLFNEGPAGIAKLRAEAAKLGLVNEDTAKSAEEFNDNLDRLGHAFNSLKISAIGPLFPVLNELAEKFISFAVESRPAIVAFSKEFARDLPKNLRRLKDEFVALKERMKPVIDFGSMLVEKFGLLNVALGAFAIFIGAPLIAPLAGLATAFISLGVALAPIIIAGGMTSVVIGGIVLAVGALAAGTYLLIKNWSKVEDFFKNMWGNVLDQFDRAVAQIKRSMNALIDSMPEGFKNFFGVKKFQIQETKSAGSPGLGQKFAMPDMNFKERTAPEFGPSKNLDLTEINKVLTNKKEVTVKFENAPPGMKVKESGAKDKDFNVLVHQGLQGVYGG